MAITDASNLRLKPSFTLVTVVNFPLAKCNQGHLLKVQHEKSNVSVLKTVILDSFNKPNCTRSIKYRTSYNVRVPRQLLCIQHSFLSIQNGYGILDESNPVSQFYSCPRSAFRILYGAKQRYWLLDVVSFFQAFSRCWCDIYLLENLL